MRTVTLLGAALLLALCSAPALRADSIDGGVLQVDLPKDDYTLHYIEAKGGFSMALRGDLAAIEGRKMYLGNGDIALEIYAHSSAGIMFQGDINLHQGYKFKKDAVIDVKPGYKRAVDLAPGDVYVVLTGVTFRMPKK